MGDLAERRPFVDNRDGNTVASALHAFGAYDGHQRPIAIASGYFDLGGFLSIADVLERAPAVRILLGTEPEPPRLRRVALPGAPPATPDLRARLAELQESLHADRDLLPFASDTNTGVQRLLAFLDRPTTEVKIFRSQFLHGKAFIFGDEAGVLAGSANFTAAGLNRNLELNLGVFDPDKVAPAYRWFEDLWAQAGALDLADVYRGRELEYDPHTIYLRMLYELYGTELASDPQAWQAPGATLDLAEFQKLGVQRALRILDKWQGVLLADGVGLGKTYMAGELIEHHLVAKGWRVLVVTPASLRDATWRDFIAKHTRYAVEVISYQQLANDRQVGDPPNGATDGRQRHLQLAAEEYRCIVIDEAHAFRSSETTYYRALRRLMAAGGVEKRLILLTATPVNNSLWDLYWQLLLFARTESRFREIGVPNLRDYIARAMDLDLEALSPRHLFPLLDQVSVRRTRSHIKRWFPGATLSTPAGPKVIEFPEPRLHKVAYETARPDGSTADEFFGRVRDAIDGGLSMARYQPDLYRIGGEGAPAQQVTAGLLLSQLLKRFESSIDAFRKTLRTMIGSHERFLHVLDQGFVAQPRSSPEAWEEGLDDDSLRILLEADEHALPIGEYAGSELREHVLADRQLLERLLAEAESVDLSDDPKLDALLDTLDDIHRSATHEDERKVVLFSYFADTIDYVERYLASAADPRAARYRGRMASVSGAQDSTTRQRLVWGFVPRSSEAPPEEDEDRFDLMLSTDVLAEGQNLQQAGRVINFDLPWNPMRLVQRNGRVDRIGSPHKLVHLYTFFADRALDDLLDLEAKLRRKIAQANAAVGTEGAVLPGDKAVEHVFDDTRADIERIAAEDESIIEEKESELDAFSGEVFREELRQALMAARERELRELPWGIGSGFSSDRARGVVFAARAGSRVEWRYVPIAEGSLSDNRLELLGMVRCTPETLRQLRDSSKGQLYALWERARDDIYAEYVAEQDPAQRAAAVPKAQRDAVQVLYGSNRLEQAVQEHAIEALQVPWPPTVSRTLRQILDRPDASLDAKAEQIAAFVRAEGLRAPALPIEPPITRDDIHLICYQVVEP